MKKKVNDLGFEPDSPKEAVQTLPVDSVGFEPDESLAQEDIYSSDYIPGMPPKASMGKVLSGAASVLDVMESPVRAGVSEFTKGKYVTGTTKEKLQAISKGLKAAGGQLVENIQDPLNAPAKAPSYSDILGREMRANTLPNLLIPEQQKKVGSIVGGLAAEVAAPSATASLIAKSAKTGAIGEKLNQFFTSSKEALKSIERKQMANIIGRLETKAQYRNSKISPEEVAVALVDEDVSKFADDPDKMLTALTGESPRKYEAVSPGLTRTIKEKPDGGIIGRKSKAMKSELSDLAKKSGVEIEVPDFTQSLKAKLKNTVEDPLSGRIFSPEEVAKRNEIVDQILKPYEEEWVPGIPLEAAKPNPRLEVPPPIPLGPADTFPGTRQSSIPELDLPQEPTPPMAYGGIVSEEAQTHYYSVKRIWEEEVAKLQKDHQEALKKGSKYDEMVEEEKVKAAAQRFAEKAKRNDKYKKEVMDADSNYQQHLVEALNRKVFNKPRSWSLKDMMDLRTNIGKRLSSAEFHSDKPLTMEKEILETIYHDLRGQIAGKLEGIKTNIKGFNGEPLDAADYYDLQSEALRRMIQGSEVLKNAALNKYKSPDSSAQALSVMLGGGAGIGLMAGNYLMGGNMSLPTTLAGTAATVGVYRQAQKGAPQLISRGARAARMGAEFAEQNPELILKGIGAGARMGRDNYVMENPEPQPMQEPATPPGYQFNQASPAFRKPLGGFPKSTMINPREIINFRIPRSTDGILQNKDKVVAKLAQNGIPDEMLRTVAQALDGDKQDLADIAPLLATQFPALFERSKYKVFDGIIIDPNDKARISDVISKRTDVDSITRAKAINEINTKGTFPEGLV
jgi:hypothetical protein